MTFALSPFDPEPTVSDRPRLRGRLSLFNRDPQRIECASKRAAQRPGRNVNHAIEVSDA